MGVRAKWHTATVAVDDTDPFADDTTIEQAVHVPTVGLPIDSPKAKLCRLGREQDTLVTLIRVRQHGQQRRRP
jgi:hypothetical protein